MKKLSDCASCPARVAFGASPARQARAGASIGWAAAGKGAGRDECRVPCPDSPLGSRDLPLTGPQAGGRVRRRVPTAAWSSLMSSPSPDSPGFDHAAMPAGWRDSLARSGADGATLARIEAAAQDHTGPVIPGRVARAGHALVTVLTPAAPL